MTRYDKDHKAEIRQRIVLEAARLFRQHGYSGVGIDTIMAAANLTRGGFYHHFGSKSDLLAAVLDADHDFIVRMQQRDEDALSDQGIDVALGYLAPENRANVSRGCSIAALSMEAARGNAEQQHYYGQAVATLLQEFERGLSDPQVDDPRAVEALALCVGGLLLSAAVGRESRSKGDQPLADQISEICQVAVRNRLQSLPN